MRSGPEDTTPAEEKVMADHSIQTDPDIQHIDVRLYFDKDEDKEHLLTNISDGLQAYAGLASMVAAYELVPDGFGRTVPDTKPLA